MKSILFNVRALALLCALFVSVHAVEEVKIGAWNIQHLGASDKRPKATGKFAQVPADLATYIKDSGVCILALEEMYDTDSSGKKANSTLDSVCDILNGNGPKRWKYLLFANRSVDDDSQLCGILWNESVATPVGDPLRIELKLAKKYKGNTWDRHPTAMKFSFGTGKTDIVVVPLHMKSNVSKEGQNVTVATRKREAMSLTQALSQIEDKFKDNDIVLMGDTNIASESEPALDIFETAGFVDLNEGGLLSSYYTGKVAFDRIFVREDEKETKDSEMEVHQIDNMPPKTFLKKYSDHYMVTTTITVMADDDN